MSDLVERRAERDGDEARAQRERCRRGEHPHACLAEPGIPGTPLDELDPGPPGPQGETRIRVLRWAQSDSGELLVETRHELACSGCGAWLLEGLNVSRKEPSFEEVVRWGEAVAAQLLRAGYSS